MQHDDKPRPTWAAIEAALAARYGRRVAALVVALAVAALTFALGGCSSSSGAIELARSIARPETPAGLAAREVVREAVGAVTGDRLALRPWAGALLFAPDGSIARGAETR